MSEDRGQRTEDRGQKTEGRGQNTEDRGQMSEDRGQIFEFGIRNAAFDGLRRDKFGKRQSAWRKAHSEMAVDR